MEFSLDKMQTLFGRLYVFMFIALAASNPTLGKKLATGQADVLDREIFGKVDISGASSIKPIILASDEETDGVRNFNSNQLKVNENIVFDKFRIAFANNASGVATADGNVVSPAVYNVFYSPDIWSKNEHLLSTRISAAVSTTVDTVPVQRIPNALLNSTIELKVGGKILLKMSARRILEACSKNDSGYLELNVPRLIKEQTEIELNIKFASSGAAMPATSYIEYSIAGLGTALKA